MGEFKAGSLSYYSVTEPHMLCSSPGLRVEDAEVMVKIRHF